MVDLKWIRPGNIVDRVEDQQRDMKDKCILNKTAVLLEPGLLSGKLEFLDVTEKSKEEWRRCILMSLIIFTLNKKYQDDNIKEAEVDMECSMHRREEKYI
jgi:hypothetical protein